MYNDNIIYLPTPDESTSFTYSSDNNLTHADLPDGSDLDFTYDAAGRRLEKKYTKVINNVTYETKYTYHYIGSQITTIDIQGKEDETITKNDQMRIHLGANSRPISFEYYTDIGTEQQTSATYYYHYDLHGNVIRVTDDTGTTEITYAYDALGTIVSETNTNSIYNPFTWSGEAQILHDPEFNTTASSPVTGLYNSGSGYYNPETGTFLSGTGAPADVNPTSTRHEDVSAMLSRPMEQQVGSAASSTQGGLTVGAKYAPATSTAPEDPYEGMDKAGMIRIESGDLNLSIADPESVLIRNYRGTDMLREPPDDGTIVILYGEDDIDPIPNQNPRYVPGGNGSALDNPYASLTDQLSVNYDCVPVDDIPLMTLVKPQVVQDQGNYRPNMPEEEEGGLAFVGGGSGDRFFNVTLYGWYIDDRDGVIIGSGVQGRSMPDPSTTEAAYQWTIWGEGVDGAWIDVYDVVKGWLTSIAPVPTNYDVSSFENFCKLVSIVDGAGETSTCINAIKYLLKRRGFNSTWAIYDYLDYASDKAARLVYWILKFCDLNCRSKATLLAEVFALLLEYEAKFGLYSAQRTWDSFKKWLVKRLNELGYIRFRNGKAE